MKKYIDKFHYLTQDLDHRSHAEQARIACEAGAKWIQYRSLYKSDIELLQEINEIAAICDDWGATLIVTNHYHLLDKADIQGVHIEDFHADFLAIRRIIGEEKTLGASALNIDDVIRINNTVAVDYIGCGPYAHTDTKPNDYPLLGIKGYKDIVGSMHERGIDIPLLAVGGVTDNDVDELLNAGVYGVAVSAAVNKATNPAEAYKAIYRKIR